jgi:hypothetical protein
MTGSFCGRAGAGRIGDETHFRKCPSIGGQSSAQSVFPCGFAWKRLDFVVYYDGRRGVAVELERHDSHKSKDQRGYDAERANWLMARGIRVVRFNREPGRLPMSMRASERFLTSCARAKLARRGAS